MKKTFDKAFASQFTSVADAILAAEKWEKAFPGMYCDPFLQQDHKRRSYWIVPIFQDIGYGNEQFEGWVILED